MCGGPRGRLASRRPTGMRTSVSLGLGTVPCPTRRPQSVVTLNSSVGVVDFFARIERRSRIALHACCALNGNPFVQGWPLQAPTSASGSMLQRVVTSSSVVALAVTRPMRLKQA
jgi:hypothetical protein